MTHIPSERYILTQRRNLFFDEWGWYGSLFALLLMGWFLSPYFYLLLIPVLPYGVFALRMSYKKQWKLERARFGKDVIDV